MLRWICNPRIWGFERIPLEGPLIVAANHASYLDPILLGALIPREIHFMAQHRLFWGPLGWLIRKYNAFPVRRGEADLSALRHAIGVLRQGGALLIFPEGTRGTGEELLEARKGIGFLATRTGAPVLPVLLNGTHRVLGRQHRWIHRAQVDILIGRPMRFERDREPEAVAQAVRKVLAQLRAEKESLALDSVRWLG
ncbi:MAG: 1-acyl-sn-glycerol-3-phosphate acyltransferase [Candidatus Poribacteria bacterium]|nr:MAG: 1-acyl-sn-glycerol-3-phosphate acyltransferase [Candidatus Poribacteria bacterium]